MVENAIRYRCIEQHKSLEPLGGHAVAGYHENFAPLDPKIMEKTINAVRNYGAKHGAMSDVEHDQCEDAPVQRKTARVKLSM